MTVVNLKDFVFFQEGPGVRKSQYTTNGIKLLNVGNIQNGRIQLSNTNTYISEYEANGKYKHFLADEGDLIIASSGIKPDDFNKKVAFISKEHLPLCMNTSTIRFKSKDVKLLDLNYLKYFFMSNYFKNQVKFYVTGSAQLNFGPSHLNKMKLLLPTLTDQKLIVDHLEKIEQLKDKRELNIRRCNELIKSIFHDMFGDSIQNEKNWEVYKVKEIAELINGRAFKPKDWGADGLKIIRIQNLNNENAEFNYYSGVYDNKYIVNNGDILLSWSGTPGTSFGVFIWNRGQSILNQHIFNVKLTERINKIYFKFYINSKLNELISKSHGGVGLQHITKSELDRININTPPMELQEKFAKKVEIIEKLKQQQIKSKEEIDNLFNCLMQKYFNGDIN